MEARYRPDASAATRGVSLPSSFLPPVAPVGCGRTGRQEDGCTRVRGGGVRGREGGGVRRGHFSIFPTTAVPSRPDPSALATFSFPPTSASPPPPPLLLPPPSSMLRIAAATLARQARAVTLVPRAALSTTPAAAAAATAHTQGAQAAPGSPFHHAFPVHDLEAAKDFYGRVLGCEEGRSSPKWQDFSLHGHQIVCHWVGESLGLGLGLGAGWSSPGAKGTHVRARTGWPRP